MGDEMKAGRELDALIAENVFKRKVVYVGGHPHLTEGNDNYLGGDCPHFSTQIADAWLVVEKLPPPYTIGRYNEEWVVTIARDDDTKQGRADTAPLAICLAALKAVE